MNRIKKKITVRFFSIEAHDNFFNDFVSIHTANQANNKPVRIINIREKKHLIKIHSELKFQNNPVYFISVVRERNTWQIRALSNGQISGIPLNQGIIGDPYYFVLVPKNQIVLGFTTGLSGSLKSMAATTLQQFNKDRISNIKLEHISKNKEFSKLRELKGYNKLHFKVDASSLTEATNDTPGILRDLFTAPFMLTNSQIALTFSEVGKNGFSEKDLIEIVDYLSENEGCTALTVQGLDDEGVKVHLDFSKAYAIYKTQIEVRDKFIDEKNAQDILLKALHDFDKLQQ
ncbi:MAG: hypothetical protein ABIJ59_03520 [Pseudomonadota bacterium]